MKGFAPYKDLKKLNKPASNDFLHHFSPLSTSNSELFYCKCKKIKNLKNLIFEYIFVVSLIDFKTKCASNIKYMIFYIRCPTKS